MKEKIPFEFCINGLDADTIGLERLSLYIKELIKGIFGNQSEFVQLESISKGSTKLNFQIEKNKVEDLETGIQYNYNIESRINSIQKLLEKHKSSAELKTPNGKIYAFPGIKEAQNNLHVIIKSIKRKVRGKIISISGKDETINIQLLRASSIEYPCVCDENTAKKLSWGDYIIADTVGDWIKIETMWQVAPRKKLKILDYKVQEIGSKTLYEQLIDVPNDILSNETFEKIQEQIRDSRGYNN